MLEDFLEEVKENLGVNVKDESIELLSKFQYEYIEELAAKYLR